MILDRDLASVQEVRNLVEASYVAQKAYARLGQKEVDYVVEGLSKVAFEHSESLAKLACEETGFGKWEDKLQKNVLASKTLWQFMKDMKTIGVLNEDPLKKVIQIGTPMGVIAGIIDRKSVV